MKITKDKTWRFGTVTIVFQSDFNNWVIHNWSNAKHFTAEEKAEICKTVGKRNLFTDKYLARM